MHARALAHVCFVTGVEPVDIHLIRSLLRPSSLVRERNAARHDVGQANAHRETASLVGQDSVIPVAQPPIGASAGWSTTVALGSRVFIFATFPKLLLHRQEEREIALPRF
jgi:hypothetical protein